MNKVAKFEKVSYNQFKKDWIKETNLYELGIEDEETIDMAIREIYDSIKLPKRATTGSAGYDFFCPIDVDIPNDHSIKIPTGIRCKIENGWVLQIYPRSGHGFKYGVRLANTVGIVDSDYYYSDNEGHIFVKLVNESIALGEHLKIKEGEAFCQGIFSQFGITVDDDADGIRNGGFGSTSK